MTKQIERLPFFVYGTLLPGHHNYKRFFDKTKPVGHQTVVLPEHALIGTERSGFPYMAALRDMPAWVWPLVTQHTVKGMLLTFDDADFDTIRRELDMLEGVPDHYDRKIVEVDARTTGSTKPSLIRAWTYYAPAALVKALLPYPFIPNGDWDSFEKKRQQAKEATSVSHR